MRPVILALSLLVGISGAAADEPRPVTLAEATAAGGQAPGAAASRARVTVAERALAVAGAWSPTSVGVATTAATARMILTLSLPLPIFGTLKAGRATARAELEVARGEQGAVALELRRRVVAAWLELARSQARADLAAEAAARALELAEVARKRFESGDSARADSVAAAAAAARANADASDAAAAAGAASAELAGVLGWDPGVRLAAAGGLPDLPPPPDLAALRERARRHPALAAARARVDAAAARAREAHLARLPGVALEGEAAFQDPTLPGNDYRVGVVVELPLFGKGEAQVTAAEAEQRAVALEGEVARQETDAAVVAAFRRYQAAAARADALATTVVPAEREAAELAATAFREGQGDLAGVLNAARARLDVEGELVDARAAAAAALADLEAAAGGSP